MVVALRVKLFHPGIGLFNAAAEFAPCMKRKLRQVRSTAPAGKKLQRDAVSSAQEMGQWGDSGAVIHPLQGLLSLLTRGGA